MRDNDNQVTLRFNTDESAIYLHNDGSNSSRVVYDYSQTGRFDGAAGFSFSQQGVLIESDYSESGGFQANGNNANVWSPGDANLVNFYDEDGMILRGYINGFSGAYVASSDRNKKQNINQVENALDKILALNGYTYEFKLNKDEIEKGNKPQLTAGVIAQEVQEQMPEVVEESEGALFMNHSAMTPYFIEAFKEQQAQIDELKAGTPLKDEPAQGGDPALDMKMLKEMQQTLVMQQELIKQQQEQSARQQQLIDDMTGEMARLRGLLEKSQSDDQERFEEMLTRIYLSEQAIIELGSCCDEKNGENSLETGDNETLLFQNHPNPFNKTTTITYKLAKAGHTELVIYDETSLPVETIVNEEQDAGVYNVEWDGTDFTSGVYIYMLKQNDVVLAKKMVLIK